MERADDAVGRWAEARGYQVALGPAQRLTGVWDEIRGRYGQGELDGSFYRGELAPIVDSGQPPAEGTVVVVAKPCSATRVFFETDQGRVDAVMPPTYLRYRATFEEVRQDLAAALPGWQVDVLTGPLKAIAARLGLVRYGRNNLTYARELGSYVQLCGFVTNAPLRASSSADRHPQLLDQCVRCAACRRVCPTRAIDESRDVLRAERCLTLLNENAGEWPEWLPSSAHSCLLGCLECQRVCPANPPLRVEDAAVCFSREETQALLARTTDADLSYETGIGAKLAWLGQPYAEPVLGRNLRALLVARAASAGNRRSRGRLSS